MPLLTPRDLAEMLHLSTGHVYRLVAQRRIPFVKLGGAVRFRRESIEAWIAKKEIGMVGQTLGKSKHG